MFLLDLLHYLLQLILKESSTIYVPFSSPWSNRFSMTGFLSLWPSRRTWLARLRRLPRLVRWPDRSWLRKLWANALLALTKWEQSSSLFHLSKSLTLWVPVGQMLGTCLWHYWWSQRWEWREMWRGLSLTHSSLSKVFEGFVMKVSSLRRGFLN